MENQRPTLQAERKRKILLAQAALLTALAYIGFQFLRLDIPTPAGKTAFHFGNVFLLLAALLLGGLWGGLAGALGMTLADLTSGYAMYAPSTFILKMSIGLIVGYFAHRVFRIRAEENRRRLFRAVLLSCAAGLIFNIVADPIVGYFIKRYIFALEANPAAILAKMSALTTFVNAILALIASSSLYLSLRPALQKAGLFP